MIRTVYQCPSVVAICFSENASVRRVSVGIGVQLRVDERAGEVAERPADIPFTQLNDTSDVLSEPTYVQCIVEKQRRDVRAIEQVLHVALRQRQIVQLRTQFNVDRLQLLVHGLRFFLGSC
jgi:hypothetical protein